MLTISSKFKILPKNSPMDNLLANYKRILEVLQSISENTLLSYQRRKPKLSDIELISICLTAEYLGIDSENYLFRLLPKELKQKIERSVYNRRKRRLFFHIEALRVKISKLINNNQTHFIIDSMPLEVCKLSRSNRAKICKEQYETSPNQGYCASQSMYFYGYKLHAVCSFEGVFHSIDLTKASVHDIRYLEDVKHQMNDCVIIGDKGYLSSKIQLDLFESANIELSTPKRKNQLDYKPQFFLYQKGRKRIETLFSQLCDQFMIKRNYAKSFDGYRTRILSKITALTTIQYINKFLLNRNLNTLKKPIV